MKKKAAVPKRYIPLGTGTRTKLMRYAKKGGTGKNENFHGGINRLVHGMSHIGVQAMSARLLQHVFYHNLKMDVKLGKTSPQSGRWPWRECALNELARLILTALPFPNVPSEAKILTEDLDPMGFEYHIATKAAQRRETRNAASRMIVASRRGNNRSPSSVAGAGAAAAAAGPATAPPAEGRAGAAGAAPSGGREGAAGAVPTEAEEKVHGGGKGTEEPKSLCRRRSRSIGEQHGVRCFGRLFYDLYFANTGAQKAPPTG
eukprot:g12185.t1